MALSLLYSSTLTSIHDHWKNHSLTRRTFVGKVISLLFNMLSRLVIAFLPRSKHLLILWLQSPSAVILEPPKIKSVTVSPSISHQVSDAIQSSHPLLSPSLLPSIFPSIRFFSNESVLRIRWPKYWSFSVRSSPSNEYSGLISFRIDLLDLLAVQGTLKSLLRHHSSKASVLRCSAFFIVQLSHPHMTTGKTIALTRWTFVSTK